MKHVYLAQLKCPTNHCVLAAADEYEDDEASKALGVILEQTFIDLVAKNPGMGLCVLCGARVFEVTIGRTPYRTMAEAMPTLKYLEHRQRLTAEYVQRRN